MGSSSTFAGGNGIGIKKKFDKASKRNLISIKKKFDKHQKEI